MSAGPQAEIRSIDKLLRNHGQVQALRHHVDEVVQGAAFRGSHRSQQFLRYVIEKALEGSVNHLKERVIGIELFRRPPSYDTGEDAIVRVTASDVRKRLLQHYGRFGDASPFRINLPSGSYIPEIEYEPLPVSLVQEHGISAPPQEAVSLNEEKPASIQPHSERRWIWLGGTALALILLTLTGFGVRRWIASETTAAMLPWAEVFRTGHTTQLITSDPTIEELQELTGKDVSISDYSNQRYVPDIQSLSPSQRQFYVFYLHADNAASVDTPLAVSIARLVPSNFPIRIRSARSLRITDLQTDDNLILLGSPRSNPWFELFAGQLDFRFAFDKELNEEIIQNAHPRAGERSTYIPTARGFATGESFAVLALVQNPESVSGQVLLLAGADGEGTEAAGRLATDKPHLQHALQYCGIQPHGNVQYFELLLHIHTMAGAPSTAEVTACHRLPSHKSN
jgi:hypothetical protein